MITVGPFAASSGEWDAFVHRSGQATHCHLYGWKSVLERVFGHECVYLAARGRAGELTGALPLVRVRSMLFGDYLVSMPFLNYGGPVGDRASVRALAQHAAALASDAGTDLLELRSPVELDVDLPSSHRKVTVLLDLPAGDPKDLWKAFDAKLRSQIRRPQKEGVEVRFGPEHVDDFFRVFSHHLRDLGTPTLPRRFFAALSEVFEKDIRFGVAYQAGRPIAAGCGFRWHDEFELVWAAALRASNRIAPNMLLYWRFLERSIEEGITTFNFGRCTPGSGTHRFKHQWGGRDHPLWWYQQAGRRAATPSPDESRFRWGPRVWRRLPLPLATALGPHLVRYIP